MIKKLLYILGCLLLALLLCSIFLLTTNLGLRASLHLAGVFSGSTFHAKRADGTWITGATFNQLEIINSRYHVHAASISWHSEWHDLLHKKLTIHDLKANAIFIRQFKEADTSRSEKKFSMPSLPINIEIKDAELHQIQIQTDNNAPLIIQSISLAAHSQNNTLYLDNLIIKSQPYLLNSQGQLSLIAPYNISLKNYFEYHYDKKQILKITNIIKGNADQLTTQITANDPYHLDISGTVNDILHNGKISLHGKWDGIKLYDEKQVKMFSSRGNLAVEGSLNHYSLKIQTHFKTRVYPTIDSQLTGQGSLNSLTIQDLQLNVLNGQIHTTGNITWSPQIAWNLSIQTQKINPGSFWEGWNGSLNSKIITAGQTGKTNHLMIQLKTLSGELQGRAINGSGIVNQTDQQWSIKNLALYSNENNIYINGTLGQQNDLDWKINLNNMKAINSDAAGKLISTGKFSGDLDDIQLSNQTSIKQFAFASYKVNYLLANCNVNEQNNYQLQISGNGIQLGTFAISQVNLSSQGSPSQHQLKLTINSDVGNLFALLDGQYDKNIWHSTLEHFDFNSQQYGSWHLAKNAKIRLGKTYSIDHFQLVNGPDHIFFSGKYSPAIDRLSDEIDIQIEQLGWLQKLWDGWQNLAGKIIIQGNLNGKLAQPIFDGQIAIHKFSLTLPKFGVKINNANLSAKYNKQNIGQLSGSLLLNDSKLNLSGSLPLNSNFSPGSLNITGKNVLVYNTSEYKVYADPNIQLDYEAPTLSISGQVAIPKAEIKPKDFTSTVTLPSNVVIITKEGEQKSNFNTALDVQINLGDDIQFKLAGLNAKMAGNVRLLQSPEGLMLGQGILRVSKGYYAAYNQRLDIKTGELMFTGNAISDPNLNILATKDIKLNPFNNPSLGNNLTVGVQVTGTMRKPVVNVYSNPSLSPNDALSYLLFGQGSEDLGNNKMQALQQAASALGISGDGLTNKLKQGLGLSQLGVDSENLYDPASQSYEEGAAVSVGKNISNRLTITYSVGILIPDAILRARYIISKHFAVQTEASSYDSGGDLLYTIDTN